MTRVIHPLNSHRNTLIRPNRRRLLQIGAATSLTLAMPTVIRAQSANPSNAGCNEINKILTEASGDAKDPSKWVSDTSALYSANAREQIAKLREAVERANELENAHLASGVADGVRAVGGSALLYIAYTGTTAIAGVPLLGIGLLFGGTMLIANVVTDKNLANVKTAQGLNGDAPGIGVPLGVGVERVGMVIEQFGETMQNSATTISAVEVGERVAAFGTLFGVVMNGLDWLDTINGASNWADARAKLDVLIEQLDKFEETLDWMEDPNNAAILRQASAQALLASLSPHAVEECGPPPRKKRPRLIRN